MRTEWNLSLLYDSLTDPRLERDVKKTERAHASFAKTYKDGTAWLVEPKVLFTALEAYWALSTLPGERALYYAYYTRELNGARADADALLMRLEERLTKAGALVLFFEVRLAKVSKEQQRKFLKAPELAPYRYYLERLFISGKHTLDETEERLLALTSASRSSLWVSGVDKLVNKQVVTVGKETMPINEALSRAGNYTTSKKRRAWSVAILEQLKSISEFPESEMNALYTNAKVSDELRGFKEPYDATIMSYDNTPKSVLALVEAVSKGFSIAHDFYRLKSKILGEELTYADRSAPVGTLHKQVDFGKAVATVRKAYADMEPGFAELLDTFLAEGRIDVYPRVGKAGGAYCSSSTVAPTYVLLNHTNDLRSLSTLAHEMGHAIHSEYSKAQPVHYQNYTMSVAETASTFFERVVFNNVFETLTDKEKAIALHGRIQEDIATVFRQVAFFNFELELHRRVRTEGWVPKEEMARMFSKHLRSYLGKSVTVDDLDGYSFIYIGHFRRPFYVYSYAFGLLISNVLYEKYREDATYLKKIVQFLRAGGSDTPEHIFKQIGIDVTKPEFWETGLQTIKRDIQTLKKLVGK